MQKPIIVISGLTGIGKSNIAQRLAQELNTDIIVGDSLQFYKNFPITSNFPSKRDVKYHLLGIKDVFKDRLISYDYKKLVLEKVQMLHDQNKVPIIEGGSSFYLNYLLTSNEEQMDDKEWHDAEDEVDKIFSKIENWEEKISHLKSICSSYDYSIPLNDDYRLRKAFKYALVTNGTQFYSQTTQNKPIVDLFDVRGFFLTIPSEIIAQTIYQRCQEMINNGMMDEYLNFLIQSQSIDTRYQKIPRPIGFDQADELYNEICSIKKENKGKQNKEFQKNVDIQDEFETITLYSDDRSLMRASTAPARPLSDIEEFRHSREFFLLGQSVIVSAQLIQRSNYKYDLDSQEGQRTCKKYLKIIEKLSEAFNTTSTSRQYRSDFSKAYKILYKEGSLCYLTEILDSAQEAFPYLWVNGEKYIFSADVLESGKKLFNSFCKVQHISRNSYTRACHDNAENIVEQIKNEVIKALEEFDLNWVTFEQLYVFELMLIEADARRFISEAIETERELQSIEIREKAKGRILLDFDEYHKKRQILAKQISELNAVANSEGKGREDLQIDILLAAEGILRRISPDQSKACRNLAKQIRDSFLNIRQLLRKYEQNIEIVDPQLKNNPELAKALVAYENAWAKGKSFFLSGKTCAQLLHFSQIIEGTTEKYSEFQEQIECRDAEIFVSIPCLLVLKSLENNDKGICKYYLPNLDDPTDRIGKIYQELKDVYQDESKRHKYYPYYNYVEQLLLSIEPQEQALGEKTIIETMVHKIKQISIELQRSKPTDWNNFLDVLLGNQ